MEGRRYRLRPPEAVADEIEAVVVRTKLQHFFIVDSVFNDPREHAMAVCQAISRRRLPVQWNAFCNPVGFDAELARAMAQAGCTGVEFGLDAATPKMLEAMGKPFGQEEIRIALEAVARRGLPFLLSMLFGGPGETWADIEEAQTFLNGCALANSVFASYGIRIYEGTELAGGGYAGRFAGARSGSFRAGLLSLTCPGREHRGEARSHRAAAARVEFPGRLAPAHYALGTESDDPAGRAAAVETYQGLRPAHETPPQVSSHSRFGSATLVCDVLVIGGGAAGVAAATAAGRLGTRVVLLERHGFLVAWPLPQRWGTFVGCIYEIRQARKPHRSPAGL